MLSIDSSWANPPLIVYHGTLNIHTKAIQGKVDLSSCDENSDFGKGFYTTTSLAQARVFAENVVRRSMPTSARPAVIRFEITREDLAKLDSLWFVRGAKDADDFWNLIESCRRLGVSNRANDQWYDVVVGPVAKWYQMRQCWADYDQISFHTDKAIEILHNGRIEVIEQ